MLKVILRFIFIFFASTLFAAPIHAQIAPQCTVASGDWAARTLGNRPGDTFNAAFDVTPQGNGIDANVAFSQDLPVSYADLGVIVRFNPRGSIDVRNGNTYDAIYRQAYEAGSTYNFVVVVNVPAHTYNVYVTPAGGTQHLLAADYAFRTQQNTVTSLKYWTTYQDPASGESMQVCNFRLAAIPPSISRAGWQLQYVDSQETSCENGAAANAFDGNKGTIWHTQYCGDIPPLPHEIRFNLGASYLISGFRYLPRQDGGINGRVGLYEFYVSADGVSWGEPVAAGQFANDGNEKQVVFAARKGQYIRFRALTEANGDRSWTSMAELNVLGTPVPAPISQSRWSLQYADSEETSCEPGGATNSFDGNNKTIWHTQYCPSNVALPHEIQLNLGAEYSISGFRYLPRQDGGSNGQIGQYEFYVSSDGVSWGAPVSTGTFGNDNSEKEVIFIPVTGRFIRFRALTEANGSQFWTSLAELNVLGSPAESTPAGAVAIAISPASVSLQAGGTQQFSAAVSGGTNTGVTWSANSGTISSTGLYTAPTGAGTYTVTATSAADPAKSASSTVTVTPTASPCQVTTTSWSSNSVASGQTGAFSVSFDATPETSVVNAVVAFSQEVPSAYTDLAAIVRFNPWGYLDVMNSTGYRADYLQSYSANSTYHFVVQVNIPTRTYSVYVTPPGGTQQTLASNYRFRIEQAYAMSLNYWTGYQDPNGPGPIQVCNLELATPPAGPAGGVTVAIAPTSTSLQPGGKQLFTATVMGTTNTGISWWASSGTVTSTGLYTAPVAAGTYTVKATSLADQGSSAFANVTVVTPATPLLSAFPSSISFGSVVIGAMASKALTLSNPGDTEVTISSVTTIGSGFSVSGLDFPLTLAAGASQTATVTFAPASAGTATASLSFVSSAANSPATVALSGDGTLPLPHSITLSWQPSTSTVIGYNIYRSDTNSGSYSRLNVEIVPTCDFLDSSVQGGKTYYYVVTAVDAIGQESGYSDQVVAVVPTP